MKQIEFTLHRHQLAAWNALFPDNPLDKVREAGLFSGVQGGKTMFGSLACRNVLEDCLPGDSLLVTAPTYKVLAQATLPTFLKLHTKYVGTYNGQDNVFRTHKGVNVWFRTDTDADSIEGIPDIRFAWMDEAGKCSRKLWTNVQGRTARRQGQILYTTTWYALNWIFKEVWRPAMNNYRKDIFVTSFNSAENPSFPKEELERQKAILSPAEFQRKFLGEPGKVEGMIFDGFGDQNWCAPFNYGSNPVYGGIDWGFDHPMAIVLRTYVDHRMYTISIFKKSGLSVDQMVDLIVAQKKLFNVRHFYCGHDRPEMIAALNARGVQASSWLDGNEDYREINQGNQLHAMYIRNGQYKIFKGIKQAEDLEDEYLSYAWKESVEGSDAREQPIKVNDDLMSAERYLTIGTKYLLDKPKEEYKIPMNLAHKIDNWTPNDDDHERDYEEL